MSNLIVWLLSFFMPRQKWYRTRYLHSAHWLKFAARIRKARRYTCEKCGRKGYDVHHLTYIRLWWEWARDVALLCRRCHKLIHGAMA